MGKPSFSEEFKRDAVAQITERGYAVADVSQRLGVSQHSLYAWKRQLAKVVSGDTGKDAEIRQLKRELARVTEEREAAAPSNALSRTLRCRSGTAQNRRAPPTTDPAEPSGATLAARRHQRRESEKRSWRYRGQSW